jgi:uncharacterized repeat protein (TIGR03803 family)
MKSRVLRYIVAITLFSGLGVPVQLIAQSSLGLKYTVLYSFTGGADGGFSSGDLIQDAQGNLYGTTSNGGDPECNCGVVFKVDLHGNETVLYPFTGGTDGGGPDAGVTGDGTGNLYGTTGGAGGAFYGTVFKLSSDEQITTLYDFDDGGGTNGKSPYWGGLLRDSDGTLYGTTMAGGDLTKCASGPGCGVVFKIDSSNQFTVLYRFQGTDGEFPTGRLVRDSAGNLYGTTINGGANGAGTVFKLDPSGNETVIYPFPGGANGANPFDGVILDPDGNLYGTAASGGNSCSAVFAGCGVIFKIDANNHESTLYAFTGGPDGGVPYGGLIRDSKGNLYGDTLYGGNASQSGVVFKFDNAGRETVLYTFNGLADGGGPTASLTRDNNGNLFGIAPFGGDPNGCGIGCGVVFKIAACHTTTCHGGDDADTTESATVGGNSSRVAPANQALSERTTQDRLAARRPPGYRTVSHATAPTN